MIIEAQNTKDGLVVSVTWHNDDYEVDFVAFDKNEWVADFGDIAHPNENADIPADVQAVLHQIYLNCRNMAPVKWVKWTTYELDTDDKMFEPIKAWLGVEDDNDN